MATDAAGVENNPKRKRSYYTEEEDIVVKPSTELVPDEYEHESNDSVLVRIFRTPIEDDLADELLYTMKNINYDVSSATSLHSLREVKPFFKDLESIKTESKNKCALILIVLGFFKKDGSLVMMDEHNCTYNVHIRDIWNTFSANNCLELKNKPKIFIICTSQEPVGIESDAIGHRTVLFDKVYDFPAESDMLIVYMKTEDKSQIIKRKFVKQLCSNITAYSKKYDIIDLASHMQNTAPLIISTLTRKFYLTPSNDREHYLSLVENNNSFASSLNKIQEDVQKLHNNQQKKKGKIFSLSFRRKNEDKPKIGKKETIKTEIPKLSKTMEAPSGRSSAASTPGGRTRGESQSGQNRKISTASTSGVRRRSESQTEYDGKMNASTVSKKTPWRH